MDKDSAQRRVGNIIGIKLPCPSPADCKEERRCGPHMAQQGPDLRAGVRSEDNVHQGRDAFHMLVSTGSASSVQEGRLT